MPFQNDAGYQLAFSADGVEAGVFRPLRLYANEGLSRPPVVEVELACPFGDTTADALLRKMAQVVVYREDGVVRRFGGLIATVRERFKRRQTAQNIVVTIESPLHFLRISSDYKIYQEKTTKEIVEDAMKACGVDPSQFADWRLGGSYEPREVCTQFGETMLQFVSRLLEEDGIFYFVEHKESGPKIVFGDSSSAYSPHSPEEVRFQDETGLVAEESFTELVELARMRPGKVTLRDHDFKKPSLDLDAQSEKSAPFAREHYEYPGRYVKPAEGKKRAKAKLDAMIAGASGVWARGHVFRATPGHTLKLSDSPRGALDGDWVVAEVDHSWETSPDSEGGSTYDTAARLLPKSLRYAPPAATPKPRVPGPQTALVTCPPGDEIHCDEFGRIKVKYTWDRYAKADDKSSSWVRVGQMHTSGSVVIPRVGWEVLVEFEDGDPDKPMVLGRLYNGKDNPPAALPKDKTQSSLRSYSSPGASGHNEIRIQDGAGGEAINVHAQKDMNSVVANNKEEKVTTNSTHGVVANHTLKVGANQTVKVGAKDDIKVGGSQKWTVGAARMKTVTGDEKYEVKGSRTVSIGAVHVTTTPKSDELKTHGDFSETVGGVCLEAAALGTSIATAGSCAITVGGAKIEAVAAGKTDTTIGARASTIGGALINASGKDVSTTTSAAKSTTVGGAWMANAGATGELSSAAALSITVGGAVAMNGTEIILKVGGSNVTIAAGGVVITADEIKLTATGPNAELAPMVGSK